MKTKEELNALKEKVDVLKVRGNEILDESLLKGVNGGYEETDEDTRMVQLVSEIIRKANNDLMRKFISLDQNDEQIGYWKDRCQKYYFELSLQDQKLVDKYLELHPEYNWR